MPYTKKPQKQNPQTFHSNDFCLQLKAGPHLFLFIKSSFEILSLCSYEQFITQ